jgi:signal transduction histidine kinase/FixJ family two-component response regulator
MSEFIIFELALLSLIYSENRGYSLSLIGFITLISGDFFVNYSFLSQTSSLLNYGELLWFLGLLFILFSIFLLHENKDYSMKEWFSRTNTIKNRLAFWSFGTSILSFLLFFIMAYIFSAINTQLFLGLPIFVMMYSVIVVMGSIYMGRRFESPFKKLTANVEALMLKNDKSTLDDNFSTQEFIFLQRFIVNAFEVKEQKELAQQALLNLTAQVAHDIRSPLAAINTVVSNVTSIPENKRIMIRNAANRINDIANNLLLKSKNNFFEAPDININTNDSPELIFVVLDNIVAEKRYEYDKTNIDIKLSGSDCSYNCFSNIHLSSFKRVLSNLINNGIEAVSSNGSIAISVTCNNTHVEIIIEDNGCGIPSNILPKITEQGFSFNKKNGAGFGLSYAKQYLEQIKGTLHIHSKEKIGTKITIRLARSSHPSWFCNSININYDSLIVILDDDPSIHDAWDERFAIIPHVELIHFYKVAELLQHKIDPTMPILYLVDYELLADNKNGLDVIEELTLNDKAILVTSCFEDSHIRIRCENIGVKIIPKSFVPYIKIIQVPSTEYTSPLVFIDDDEMMRTTWAFAASNAGKKIALYSSIDEFMSVIDDYGSDTVIYIDSDLDHSIKGEIEAKKLFDLGFTEIHLATGHSPNQFGNIPWIKSIIGKLPPF